MTITIGQALLVLAGFILMWFGIRCYYSWQDKKNMEHWLKKMALTYPHFSEAGEKNLRSAYKKLMRDKNF